MNLLRKLISPILIFYAPSYGRCFRCFWPWKFANGHAIPYSENELGGAGFALCESCWAELTPEERLPFYRKLCEKWGDGYVNWETWKDNILKGL